MAAVALRNAVGPTFGRKCCCQRGGDADGENKKV
jgi:hypothetical protein